MSNLRLMPDWLLDLFARYGYARGVRRRVPREHRAAGARRDDAAGRRRAGALRTAVAASGDSRRHRRRDARRQPRLLHRPPRRPAHRRALRLARRPDAASGSRSSIASSSGTARRRCSSRASSPGCASSAPCWPAAAACAGRHFSFYNAAGAVVWCDGGRVRRDTRWRTAGTRSSAGSGARVSIALASSWSRSVSSRRCARGGTRKHDHTGLRALVPRSEFLRRPRASSRPSCCTDPAASRSSIPDRRARCRRCAAGSNAPASRSRDVRAILLTHIHLDHAGATGTLVRENPAHPRLRARERRAAHGRSREADGQRDAAVAATRWIGCGARFRPVPADELDRPARRRADRRRRARARGRVHAGPRVASRQLFQRRRRASRSSATRPASGCRPGGYMLPPTPPPDIDLEAVARQPGAHRRVAAGDAVPHALRPVRTGGGRISPRWPIT